MFSPREEENKNLKRLLKKKSMDLRNKMNHPKYQGCELGGGIEKHHRAKQKAETGITSPDTQRLFKMTFRSSWPRQQGGEKMRAWGWPPPADKDMSPHAERAPEHLGGWMENSPAIGGQHHPWASSHPRGSATRPCRARQKLKTICGSAAREPNHGREHLTSGLVSRNSLRVCAEHVTLLCLLW